MREVLTATAVELLQGYRTRSLSPVEVVGACLRQIEEVNGDIGAVFAVDAERCMAAARASEGRWRAGEPAGELDGVPVTVKDGMQTVGMPSYNGSAPNAGSPPATVDCPPSARLKEAGAVILGKTVMPDFGLIASGVSSMHGIARNPWNLAFSPGGSSAGAGAALAAGIGALAAGSDIAGSVRLPAGQCGLVGLKPTQGRVPHLPSSTMRTVGPMARCVEDVALLLDVLAKPDARDRLSLPAAAQTFQDGSVALSKSRMGCLVDMGGGVPVAAPVRSVLDAAVETLTDAGADVDVIPPPLCGDPYEAVDRIFQVRGYAHLQAFDAGVRSLVLPEVAQWCMRAASYSALDYAGYLSEVESVQAQLSDALADYDYVLTPVMPVVGFPAEQVGLSRSRPLQHCTFTWPFNQTGQPAVSLCFGMSEEHLPIGVQIVGRRFDDRGVLALARILQERRRFTLHWPLTPIR
ncbi:amidase [Streptomyces mirabilis]|uniref:amidase n=1 Tax=Streptomyces mirabilis TaxID=68239 RepID=UPI0036D983E3